MLDVQCGFAFQWKDLLLGVSLFVGQVWEQPDSRQGKPQCLAQGGLGFSTSCYWVFWKHQLFSTCRPGAHWKLQLLCRGVGAGRGGNPPVLREAGLGCCTLHWENWGPLPSWLSAQETQSEVLGSLLDNAGPCITFCDCEGCAPSWASIFSSFRVKKLVFGISQALHSK